MLLKLVQLVVGVEDSILNSDGFPSEDDCIIAHQQGKPKERSFEGQR